LAANVFKLRHKLLEIEGWQASKSRLRGQIEPVDTYHEGTALEAREQAFDRADFFGGLRESLAVDADWKRTDLRRFPIDK
jgi:hypothetical protein